MFVCHSATDEDFYSSLAQMAGEGFDDEDDDEVIKRKRLKYSWNVLCN